MPWTSSVSDLPNNTYGKVFMYADDTSLCHLSNDISTLESEINEDLQLLEDWLKEDKLSLKVVKLK